MNSKKIIDTFENEIEQIKTELISNIFLNQEQRFKLLDLISKTRNLINDEEQKIAERMNADFVQLYRKNIEAIVELGKKSQLAVLIFVYLLKTIDRQNAVVISQETLCDIFQVSRTTFWRAQTELEKFNFLKIVKIGTANAYVINSELVWTTYANKKEFAIFNAQVIASKKEQKVKEIKNSKIGITHFKSEPLFKELKTKSLEIKEF
jgi:hypothetical protein